MGAGLQEGGEGSICHHKGVECACVVGGVEGEACLKSPALGKREGEGKMYQHKWV